MREAAGEKFLCELLQEREVGNRADFFLSQIIWAKFTHQSPQPANTAGIHPTDLQFENDPIFPVLD